MVTIKDVAQLAQVSTSTVSRVVRKNGFVSVDARRRVEEAIKTLDYRPNMLAQGLKYNRSNLIGVVVTTISSEFFGLMVQGIEKGLAEFGMNMIVSTGHGVFAQEKKAVSSLISRRCDALILYLESELIEQENWETFGNEIPFVLMGNPVAKYAANSITINNEYGAFIATNHLIEHGHKNIVHITGQDFLIDSRDRIKGFKKAMRQKKLPFKGKVFTGVFNEEHGYNCTQELLAKNEEFTAIFAGDDIIAAGAILALREKGIRIPEDVSVIGFDDAFHARHLHPPLTTIRQPIIDIGKRASRLAMHLSGGGDPSTFDTNFVPELIVRDSVVPVS